MFGAAEPPRLELVIWGRGDGGGEVPLKRLSLEEAIDFLGDALLENGGDVGAAKAQLRLALQRTVRGAG